MPPSTRSRSGAFQAPGAGAFPAGGTKRKGKQVSVMTVDKTTETINPERAHAEKDRNECEHVLTFDGMCLDCMRIVDSKIHKGN